MLRECSFGDPRCSKVGPEVPQRRFWLPRCLSWVPKRPPWTLYKRACLRAGFIRALGVSRSAFDVAFQLLTKGADESVVSHIVQFACHATAPYSRCWLASDVASQLLTEGVCDSVVSHLCCSACRAPHVSHWRPVMGHSEADLCASACSFSVWVGEASR